MGGAGWTAVVGGAGWVSAAVGALGGGVEYSARSALFKTIIVSMAACPRHTHSLGLRGDRREGGREEKEWREGARE